MAPLTIREHRRNINKDILEASRHSSFARKMQLIASQAWKHIDCVSCIPFSSFMHNTDIRRQVACSGIRW